MARTEANADQADNVASAAIIANLVVTAVMLFALFTGTVPHPPLEVAPFALALFFGATLALGAAALYLARHHARLGAALALLFALACLVSFGPQKYFDPMFDRIWPAVITGQFATAAILFNGAATMLRRRHR